MPAPLKLEGQRFGRLSVISRGKVIKNKRSTSVLWVCKCDCGKIKEIRANDLTNGKTKSCGCFKVDEIRNRPTCHGLVDTDEYWIWAAMKDRCTNPENPGFKNYGKRGIKVCRRWMKFINFISDMGPRPSEDHSLDRFPDINGDYELPNCRWATAKEQNRGKRNNRWLVHGETKMILMDWAVYLNITHSTLRYHLEDKSISEVIAYYERKRMPKK